MMKKANLHGIKFFPVSLDYALEIAVQHIDKKNGDYFCFVNVHLIMEAVKNETIKRVLNESSGNFPDGMGVAGALKLMGHKFEGRVRGTDLMLKLCDYASKKNLSIYLYGNTDKTLISLKCKLLSKYPSIKIAGCFSPPFRELNEEEDEKIIDRINQAKPDILFVSLGAPKQEKWMAKHKGRVYAIQLGVGAAFDFITGNVKQAPQWMQRCGLEWLYRLPQQPRKTINRMAFAPSFVIMTLKQIIKDRCALK